MTKMLRLTPIGNPQQRRGDQVRILLAEESPKKVKKLKLRCKIDKIVVLEKISKFQEKN